MYVPTEVVNDYAVDHLPDGFEVTDENQVIVQDLDEDSSFEDANLIIEQALVDIDKLNNYRQLIIEAVSNPSISEQKRILSLASAFRNNLERRYNGFGSIRLTIESFHHGYPILVALEAEQTAQKGTFNKMIDAVVKAFRWLWEHVSSVLKNTPNDDVDKRNAEYAKIEKAEAEHIKPDNDTEEDVGLAVYFPDINGVVTAKDVEDRLDSAISNIDAVIKMYDVVTFSIEFIKAVGEDVKRDGGQNYADALKANETKLEIALRALPAIKAEEAKMVGIEIPANVDQNDIHGLQGFVRGGKFVIWLLPRDDILHPRSSLQTMKAVDGKRSFKVASSSDLRNVNSKINSLNETWTKNMDRFNKSTDETKRFTTDSIPSLLKDTAAKLDDSSLPKEKLENLRFAMKIFSSYSQDIGSLLSNMVNALMRCGEASNLASKYLYFSASKYVKTKNTDKSETKEPEKKEETK